jgi:hypothetical protein
VRFVKKTAAPLLAVFCGIGLYFCLWGGGWVFLLMSVLYYGILFQTWKAASAWHLAFAVIAGLVINRTITNDDSPAQFMFTIDYLCGHCFVYTIAIMGTIMFTGVVDRPAGGGGGGEIAEGGEA